jgi:hypothetical protein
MTGLWKIHCFRTRGAIESLDIVGMDCTITAKLLSKDLNDVSVRSISLKGDHLLLTANF